MTETLREKLTGTPAFLWGVELLSIRGSMAEMRALRVRELAGELAASPDIDWISITDNAGGNPRLDPQVLGKPILYAGKEVVIHLTCKDLNRNGLESAAWQLSSEGFHNVLAMTGDYPVSGSGGRAKPVFDLDSVGLIALLAKMNAGFGDEYQRTQFCIGAVVSNHKLLEGEVTPQYFKLEAKVRCGAHFVINQVGFDARKDKELKRYMDEHGMERVPLIGNVFLLSARAARLFHERRIPGITVTAALLAECERRAASSDGGRAYFVELAAKQAAIYRGLGFRGAYLCGMHDLATIQQVQATARSFSPDDWKAFAEEVRYSQPGEFFFYPDGATPQHDRRPGVFARHVGLGYVFSKWVHRAAFRPGSLVSRLGAWVTGGARDPMQGPRPLRALERASKAVLFRCRDCGDCSLPETAFLCPESRCAKNQRNGPCGGTRAGACEVDGYGDCIWVRAYQRLKHDGAERMLLQHAPVVQDQGLRGTSSWANNWQGRDHAGRRATAPGPGGN